MQKEGYRNHKITDFQDLLLESGKRSSVQGFCDGFNEFASIVATDWLTEVVSRDASASKKAMRLFINDHPTKPGKIKIPPSENTKKIKSDLWRSPGKPHVYLAFCQSLLSKLEQGWIATLLAISDSP